MPSANRTITINRPIAEVFTFVTDGAGLKGLLMGGAVQKTMDAEMAALDRLQSVLES